ncbi:MAG: hypothetical protein UU67_C0031G0002 [Candidatus Daviesbacteria bacterium GW2011_GWB1_41_5]|uniref:Rossmann fold nucleotide-binding protein n=1 Tax=Candidatus Daviesbacteria bacterium GW2011_GWB1_41_5 TaxID=1618429 RepID=A0A0G0WJZ1_9BACT|nr:MAG: hypothetical protein UU67_C0031G0002 [Candidatus Daviesbacteria bacterium GW2011_GWB1_41_5]
MIQKAQSIDNVAIFGFADAEEESQLYKDAYGVAKALAEAGYTVVDGGGPGVMKAASCGAKAGGGKVIGVTYYPKDMKNFEGRCPENPLDSEIKTQNYVERTLTLMKEGQVYVVFNGGSGTLSELGMAWGLARLQFGHHKPIILYGDFWIEILQALKKSMLLRPEEIEVYKIANSPEGVLRTILFFEDEIKKGNYEYLKISRENGQA